MGAAISRRVAIDSIDPNDIVIAVVGLAGAGKSTFINTAVGRDILPVGHGLELKVSEIQHVQFSNHERYEQPRVVFVDTPGFDSQREERIIEKKLKAWLKAVSSRELRITGILYLHRITDPKLLNPPLRHLSLLRRICEESAEGFPNRVVLVTTMWGYLQSQDVGVCHERELQYYWDELPSQGSVVSRMMRFEDSFASAWSIVFALMEENDGYQRRPPSQPTPDSVPATTHAHPAMNNPSQVVGEQDDRESQAYQNIPGSAVSRSGGSFGSAGSTVSALMDRSSDVVPAISHPSSDTNHPKPSSQSVPTSYDRARDLVSRIARNPSQENCLISLQGEDAQCIVDFLNLVLRTDGMLGTPDGPSILSLLCALAKRSQLFPRCFELKDVECDFGRPIAGGGFADVYKVKDGVREICIKAARLFTKQDNTQMLRVHVKELILWANISHQNILPFYGVYLSDIEPRRICMVSPWMKNGDLPSYLTIHPETPRIRLILDILAGLTYLHQRRIVHGDLKGSNVLISDDGRALLADFGISRLATSTKLASTRLSSGTTRWTAPEILEASGSDQAVPLTQASDIWSFGCVCYEALTHQIPFYQYRGDMLFFMALGRREIPEKPTPENQLEPIDGDIWTLMVECWDYNPKKRPICEDIQQRFKDLQPNDFPELSVPSDADRPAFWEALKARPGFELDYDNVCRILDHVRACEMVSRIAGNSSQKNCLISLQGEDAQTIIDFLNTLLPTDDSLDTPDGLSVLSLLCTLAKGSQLFPRCFELKDVECDFSRPQAGSGFADVYKAKNGIREICIKAVRLFTKQDNTQVLRAHVKELILWANISHQNILPFYGVYLSDMEPRRICIVSPWMKNGDLPSYLTVHPETPRIRLILDILAGLTYLHQRQIIHGGLKGSNVLISDDGRALLADFGISHLATSTKLASTRLSSGTTRWTAPEKLEFGDDHLVSLAQPSDVWSFGCVCYEVFTGKIPFYQHKNDIPFFMALGRREIPMKPTPVNQLEPIDGDIWALMVECWDYDPKMRPICEDIRQRFKDLRPNDFPEPSALSDADRPAFWEAMKARSGFELDYDNICRILERVQADASNRA